MSSANSPRPPAPFLRALLASRSSAIIILLFLLSRDVLAQVQWRRPCDSRVLYAGEEGDLSVPWAPWVEYDEDEGRYKMWYTVSAPGLPSAIAHGVSADGVRWDRRGARVLEGEEPWETAGVYAAAVLIQDGEAASILPGGKKVYRMWYTGSDRQAGRFGLAESLDGIDWMKHPGNPIFDLGPAGSWEGFSLFFPSVLFSSDKAAYEMWYGGFDGRWRIGYATSQDGVRWERHPANPVIDSGPAISWEGFGVLPGQVLFDGAAYHMWYTGFSFPVPTHRAQSLGYATSASGSDWTKHPFNPSRELASAPGTIRHASVLRGREDQTLVMWYQDDIERAIRRAASNLLELPPAARVLSTPGDSSACPPRGGGPLRGSITRALGSADAGERITVREVCLGPFGPESVRAGQGGSVAPWDPKAVTPLGLFQDSRLVLTYPDCRGQPGEHSALHDDGGTPGDPADDSYTLTNVGQDIWQLGDTFTFAYSRVHGDFQLTARIRERDLVPGSRWGKFGVMARQDLGNRSRFSMMLDCGEYALDATRWNGRWTHGGSDTYDTASLPEGQHHD
jgi:predicted GH43/DUF377 family glycosyl hydrolase